MRTSLQRLFGQAITLQYKLPVDLPAGQIPRAVISTTGDDCLRQLTTNQDISSLIYNGIVEYAYNDYEIDLKNLNNMQLRAFQNKIKYNSAASMSNKIGYGFHAEVLLHLILDFFYHAQKCVARGYMYHPLENSEIKGYDSYLMVEDTNGRIYCVFGEAKAYINRFEKSVDMILSGLAGDLNDSYLHKNFLAFENIIEKINPASRIPQIIDSWRNNPIINMAVEAAKYNMEFVYPMFIMYDKKSATYEESILKIVNYINTNSHVITYNMTLPHTLFFIFLPVDNCRDIKKQVVEWIIQKQPVML